MLKERQARHVICSTGYEAAAMARPEEYPPLRREKVRASRNGSAVQRHFRSLRTAQYAMRHVKKYGLTREQLAQIAINGRANAAINPRALVRQPLTLDEYMTSRMVSTPLCLHDCDRFTDASTVVIVSAGDALDEVSATPIRIAASAGTIGRPSWDQVDIWRPTRRPGPVEENRLQAIGRRYRPFTTAQLPGDHLAEGWAFVKSGGRRFIEGGKRIARDGELPLNTSVARSRGPPARLRFAHRLWCSFAARARASNSRRSARRGRQLGRGPLANCLLLSKD